MAETEKEAATGASLDLSPDAWRNKTQDGYSVTEGMDQEPFTERFQQLYKRIQEKESGYLEKIRTDIFLDEMEIQAKEERIRERLFTEVGSIKKQEETENGISGREFVTGMGFMTLLFIILTWMTFRKKKRKSTGLVRTGE